MKSNRIVIEVLGGNVVGVYAERPLKADVAVVDWDNIKADPDVHVDDVERQFDAVRAKLIELDIGDVFDIIPRRQPTSQ